MFKISIICLGKFKELAFVNLEKEYLKRLNKFSKVRIVELPEVSYGTESEIPKAKRQEAAKIIKNLPKNSIVILLSENGQERTSEDFASFLERIGSLGQELVFVIGSGIGLDPSLKEVSNYQISLSKLTFTHNFARVLLEEQIYRACTIIAGTAYHKA